MARDAADVQIVIVVVSVASEVGRGEQLTGEIVPGSVVDKIQKSYQKFLWEDVL